MSRVATDWAWTLEIKPATQKLILLAMADRADEFHKCYPSYDRLVRDTGLNKKTVEDNIKKIESRGFISDTGKRVGRTKSVKIWLLNVGCKDVVSNPEIGTAKQPQNRSDPNFEATPILPPSDPNIGQQATPILPPSDPNIGVQNQSYNQSIEPVIETTPLSPQGNDAEKQIQSVAKNDNVNAVFEFWKNAMGHSAAKMDGKREGVIKKALKWGYSVTELCQAVDGCSKTPFNCGDNDRGQRYDSIQLIFKDADQIDRFVANSLNPPRAMSQAQTIEAQNAQALADFEAHKRAAL